MARIFVCLFAALCAVAVSADSSDGCNYGQVAGALVHALQTHDSATVEALYHRNAIRYDNGKLSALTHGKPVTALQYTCAWKRVDVRYELRSSTSDHSRHTVMLVLRSHVEKEEPFDTLVSLEFDRRTCQVSIERTFYPTEHAGYLEFIEKTKDDCWGPEVNLGGPVDNLIRIRDCYGHLEKGRAQELSNCYADDATGTLNGAPTTLWTKNDYAKLFDKVKFTLTGLSLVQDKASSSVSAVVQGVYTLKDGKDGNDAETTFPFIFATKHTLRDNKIVNSVSIYDEAQVEEALRFAGFKNDKPKVPETWEFGFRAVRDGVKDVSKYFGEPFSFNNVEGQAGYAMWVDNSDPFACLSRVYVRDEAVNAPKSKPTDPPTHNQFLYTDLQVDIPNVKFFNIQKVTPSITYDYLAKTLVVRGDSLGSAVLQTWMALKYATGALELKTLQANYGKGYDLIVHVDAAGNRRFNPDGTVAYTQLFMDMGKQICSMKASLKAPEVAPADGPVA